MGGRCSWCMTRRGRGRKAHQYCQRLLAPAVLDWVAPPSH
jgi:hypothetical protein